MKQINSPPFLSLLFLTTLACAGGREASKTEPLDIPDRFVEMIVREKPATAASPEQESQLRALGYDDGPGRPRDATTEEKVEAALRAWFPETFLWEPLVVTDREGKASADLTVPDSLTSWRILALAHSRGGEQAGSLAHFSSTLPVYADIVLPVALRVGDRIRLPVQVVNNEENAKTADLLVSVEGSAAGHAGGSISVGPWASAVRYVDVTARTPGEARVSVRLGSTDRVERSVLVVPAGRKISLSRGGTLGAARELVLGSEEGLMPNASSVGLVVYPGPVSFVLSELATATARIHDLPSAAYACALVGEGRVLASRWGMEPGEKGLPSNEELRTLGLRAWQGIVRRTRAGGPREVLWGLWATSALGEEPLARGLADRLGSQLLAAQSPDGSFASIWGTSGATLDQALVFSALATRLAGEGQRSLSPRARGFILRNGSSIQSPYTAAVVLASGIEDDTLEKRLRLLLQSAVTTRADQTRWLEPGPGATRFDGSTPGAIETAAWAILALADDEASRSLVQELGSTLLASYTPEQGFGDAETGLVALAALSKLMQEPLPESVEVLLSGDGRELIRERLDLAGGLAPALLQVPASVEKLPLHWKIESIPPVPGLAWSMTRNDWVQSSLQRAEMDRLRVTHAGRARVGQPFTLTLLLPTSRSRGFSVEIDLPTGFEADDARLGELWAQGRLSSYKTRAGHISLQTPLSADDTAWRLDLSLVPSFAGHLAGGEASLDLGRGERFHAGIAPVEVGL